MNTESQAKTKSRTYMLALFAVFFGPLFFAMWLFYVPNSWLNASTQNHGTLIQPAKPMDSFKIVNTKGDTWDKSQFIGKWTLLYVGDEDCDLYCEASLFKMRQVRLTLGRDSQRVERKYIGIDRQKNKNSIETILKNYPGMQVKWFEEAKSQNVMSEFDLHRKHIYLIDPLGNLMMRYTIDATSKGMKKDLKRLLKVSKIG